MSFDPKTQIVFSVRGRLTTTGANSTNLAAVINAIPNSSAPLVIWFHGGLNSTAAGKETADRVGGFYGSNYPTLTADQKKNLPLNPHSIFFVWESGPGISLLEAIGALLERSIIRIAIDKLSDLLEFKLDEHFRIGMADPALLSQDHLTEGEIQVLREALEAEDEFQADAVRLRMTSTFAAAPRTNGEEFHADAAITQFIDENREGEARNFNPAIALAIARGMAKIARRVLARRKQKRDHGLKQTIIEETVRELQIPEVWRQMKRFTDDAFDQNGVGTQFLEALVASEKHKGRPIYLVGHSTGAVYIANLMNSPRAKDLEFHIRFLAPAIRFDRFARALQTKTANVASFRSYGMSDPVEEEESLLNLVPFNSVPVLRDLYKGSLLYMVSGALENSVESDPSSEGYADCPLVGMERFVTLSSVKPESRSLKPEESEAILSVRKLLPTEWVFGPTASDAPFPCNSITHGGFDDIVSGTPEAALWSLLLP